MQWTDIGLVLGVRHHGETSAIAELMTANHGRSLGLVRGGRSRKMRPVLQPGNLVNVTWRARLDEHLGQFAIEPEKLRAASLMTSRTSLYCVQIIAFHLRLLPERDANPALYEAANIILEHAHDASICAPLIARFELALLEEMGFGLSLNQCVVTGVRNNLNWVSPKSGCAVSEEAGKPWAKKLLMLPEFLRPKNNDNSRIGMQSISLADIEAALRLTAHFFDRDVYGPRTIKPPHEREKFIDALLRQ